MVIKSYHSKIKDYPYPTRWIHGDVFGVIIPFVRKNFERKNYMESVCRDYNKQIISCSFRFKNKKDYNYFMIVFGK